MTDLRVPQDQLIHLLIDEGNPGFKDKFDVGDYTLDQVTAITPASGDFRDTSVRCRVTNPNKGIGTITLKYRRIDLSKILRNITVKLNNYTATTQLTAAECAGELNRLYGLSLLPADSQSAVWNAGSSNPWYSIATSLCYKGNFTFQWTRGKRQLDDAIVANNGGSHDLNGRLWQGGNTFGGDRKTQGDYLTYGMDLSAVASTINALAASGSLATGNASLTAIVAEMNNQFGSTMFDASQAHSVQGGMGGLAFTKLTTLPNASYPLANNAKYSKVLLLTAQATSWFQGTMYLHYNG